MNFNFITSLLPVLAFMLPVMLGATGHPPTWDQDFEKTYSETFSVNGSGDVRLTNRYGDIRVETWDRDEVKIDVRVKVSADDQDDADRTFDRIEISFSGGSNFASAVTNIGSSSKKSKGIIRSLLDGEWPSWDGVGGSNDFKIHYTVKMPASANLETEAKYCDVVYNDLVVDMVERIFLDGNYSDVEINEVSKELEVDASYGDLEIDRLSAGFERVYIRVNYIDVDLDIDDDAGYELQLRTRYGNIDFSGQNISVDEDRSGNSKSLTGSKKGKGSGRVDISTSYGDIDIH